MLAAFGLGNPGRKYEGTRHNIGFAVIDRLAEDAGIRVSRRRFHARTGDLPVPGSGPASVLLAKPQTFMNDSGRCVQAAAAWHRLSPEDLLVVCDDLDLERGVLRVRRKGSSGGHRGLQSIVDALGTTEFPRLRIGIGRPRGGRGTEIDAIDYVLDRFTSTEKTVMTDAVAQAADAILCWATEGIDVCMNRFN